MNDAIAAQTTSPSNIPPPQRMIPEAQNYELTLTDYFRILVKRRFIIVASFIFVLIGSIIYTNSKTPLYSASATVRISSGARVFKPGANFFVPPVDFATYEKIVTGDEVLKRVVVRLGLIPGEAKVDDLTVKVDEIREAIHAVQVGGSDLMNISIVYHDAELAAAIVNQVADSFVDVELLQKSREQRQLRQFIEEQLKNFTVKLQTTEAQIQEFRKEGRAMGIASGLEQRLGLLEKEKILLLKQFTEKYPDVIKIDTQIDSIKERISELPQDELDLARLQRELEIHDRAYRMMKDKHQAALLQEAEQVSDVTVLSTASVPTIPISPKKTMNKITGAVVGLILGIVIAFVLENFDTAIGTIEDVEQIVKLPVVGVIPYYNPMHENASWWRFDIALLDLIKRRAPRDMPPDASYLIMNQETSSSLSEAYRILRTFVEFLLMSKKNQGKILIITSTGPQEGKSMTASNLAISLAQNGKKTLLIDADLRRPTVHRLFGLERGPGLTDVLMGTCSFDEARQTLGDILVGDTSQWDHVLRAKLLDRLEVLTSGGHTTTPAEVLTSENTPKLLSRLKEHYDYIIIDTPPVLPVTDTRSIGNLADAVFFVYRSGKTARRALTRAKDELKLAGVNVRGIILNQATPELTLTDKYYYQYYGETKSEKVSRQKGEKEARATLKKSKLE